MILTWIGQGQILELLRGVFGLNPVKVDIFS